MDTILLSWRIQNVLAIWVIVLALVLIIAFIAQAFHLVNNTKGA